MDIDKMISAEREYVESGDTERDARKQVLWEAINGSETLEDLKDSLSNALSMGWLL